MPSSVAMDHPPPLGRRSSFQAHQDAMAAEHGGQQHDGANSSSMRESNEPVIKSTDMPEQMQQHAVQAALKAQAQAKEEGAKKDLHNVMARVLKKEFDAAYGGVWHCIVGRNFGSVVTHTSRTFIYIYIGHVAVLMFKAGSQAL